MANENENAWADVEHSPVASDEFTGFANSPVDEDGKVVDSREVEAYVDKSDEGQKRQASQTTASSIASFKTEGTATNGAPAAVVVPAPKVEAEGTSDEEESDPEPVAPAEGEGANEDS